MSHIYEVEVGGKPLIIETGRLATQASGSITVALGETVVLVTVCVTPEPREGIDFFPLTIDFEERMYAVGKIPGSFLRREGRPSTDAILAGRMTDRALRPLFPKGFRNDVQIIVTVLSADQENDPDVLGTIGASAALCDLEHPLRRPRLRRRASATSTASSSSTRPTRSSRRATSTSSSPRRATRSSWSRPAPRACREDIFLEAVRIAHEANQKLIAVQDQMVKELGSRR